MLTGTETFTLTAGATATGLDEEATGAGITGLDSDCAAGEQATTTAKLTPSASQPLKLPTDSAKKGIERIQDSIKKQRARGT
jgi:hypothetical protein